MTGAGLTGVAEESSVSRSRAIQERMKALLRELLRALRETNLTALASQVAYSLIFALPSILLVFALVAHAIDQRTGFAITNEVRLLIVDALPPGVQPLVMSLIEDAMIRAREGPTTLSAIIAIAVALVAAGNGLGELATAFDRVAGIDDPRPAWQKRFIFTASAVLIALVFVVAFALYVWGGGLVALIAQRAGLSGDWQAAWMRLEAPVILLLVFLGTTLLYETSSGRYCFHETAPGAAVATFLWLIVVKGFQVYLEVANPGTAYGAASSALVFLVFLFLASLGLIVGAMTAAVIVRQERERTTRPTATTLHETPEQAVVSTEAESDGADRG